MAYAALTVAILALFVSAAAFYVVFREHAALVKSVIKSLEAAPEAVGSHIEVYEPPEPELEAITMTDEYEYELEQELIKEGRAVEYS